MQHGTVYFTSESCVTVSPQFSCSMLKHLQELAPQTPGNSISYGFHSDLRVFNFHLTASVLTAQTLQGEQHYWAQPMSWVRTATQLGTDGV